MAFLNGFVRISSVGGFHMITPSQRVRVTSVYWGYVAHRIDKWPHGFFALADHVGAPPPPERRLAGPLTSYATYVYADECALLLVDASPLIGGSEGFVATNRRFYLRKAGRVLAATWEELSGLSFCWEEPAGSMSVKFGEFTFQSFLEDFRMVPLMNRFVDLMRVGDAEDYALVLDRVLCPEKQHPVLAHLAGADLIQRSRQAGKGIDNSLIFMLTESLEPNETVLSYHQCTVFTSSRVIFRGKSGCLQHHYETAPEFHFQKVDRRYKSPGDVASTINDPSGWRLLKFGFDLVSDLSLGGPFRYWVTSKSGDVAGAEGLSIDDVTAVEQAAAKAGIRTHRQF